MSTKNEQSWGGAREGSGRPGIDIARIVSAKLDQPDARHMDQLRSREELPNDAAALRWLIGRDRELADRREARRLG